MFNTNNGYSLADIAAATNTSKGGMFGDDWAWIIILLLCGWGNGGFGYGGNGQGTVREEISYGFDMNGIENGIRGIQQGLCDGFYAMNTGMLQGFNGINNAITQGTITDMQSDFALQSAINNATTALTAQLTGMAADNAACCCALQTAIATQGCDTRRAIVDSTREIIDFLTQDKIASLAAENQTLKFAASQNAQNNFLIAALRDPAPVPAYVVPNPSGCYSACALG